MRAYYVQDLDRLMIEINPSPDSYNVTREIGNEDVLLDVDREGTPLMLTVNNASKRYPEDFIRGLEVWAPPDT